MRLTLRTLLAYRDGVLEEKDALLLESKLKESSTAQQISQRIDQGMSNPRLAPIPIDAREFGFDPNHIAEYLDDTIPAEQIPEMERRCLENNALLSEVGSCHRILAKATTQSVEIPGDLRDRILALPTTPSARPSKLQILRLGQDGKTIRIDPPTVDTFEAGRPTSESVTESVTKAAIRPTPSEPRGSGIELNEGLGHQVPEYLVGHDRSWVKHFMLGAALVGSLLLVGGLAIGPLDQLRAMLSDKTEVAQEAKKIIVEENRGTAQNTNDHLNPDNGVSPKVDESRKPKIDRILPVDLSQPNESKDLAVSPNPVNPIQPATSQPTDFKTQKERADQSEKTEISEIPDQSKQQSNLGRGLAWLPETKDSSKTVVFVSNNSNPSDNWTIIQPGHRLNSGRLFIPPLQRTELVLPSGIRGIVAGETMIDLTDDQATLQFGRLILFPTPDGHSLSIKTPVGLVAISFEDLSSSCAIEVYRDWATTTADEIARGQLKTQPHVNLYGIMGNVSAVYHTADQEKKLNLELGEIASVHSGDWSRSEMTIAPTWFRSSTDRPLDQFAVSDLAKAAEKATDKTLREVLKELAKSRKPETASFAVRTLCLAGEFDDLFGEQGLLKRKGTFKHLQTWFNRLPNALFDDARNATFVEIAQKSLESRYATVMRLIVTQSAEQFAQGGNRLLIETLSSNQIDERLLTILQLITITGNDLGFHPDRNSTEAIQQWRKLLGKDDSRPAQSN